MHLLMIQLHSNVYKKLLGRCQAHNKYLRNVNINVPPMCGRNGGLGILVERIHE